MLINQNLNDFFKSKRLFPTGIGGIVFLLDLNSGFKAIDKYPPYSQIIDNTSKNYKRDINGFGSFLEFDGIVERLSMQFSFNQHLNIDPNQKFTWACRFKVLTYNAGDLIFGRTATNPNASQTFIDLNSGNIRVYMKEANAGTIYTIGITSDNAWHDVYWGFDGTTWFIEFDGVRNENLINTHNGFTSSITWGIGAKSNGQNSCNCQITELGLIKGNSL